MRSSRGTIWRRVFEKGVDDGGGEVLVHHSLLSLFTASIVTFRVVLV